MWREGKHEAVSEEDTVQKGKNSKEGVETGMKRRL